MDRNNIQFNIGLTLSTNLKKFKRFLDAYHQHIGSVYFSLPLGMNHQTRHKVHRFFSRKKNVDMFWEMLRMIKAYGIELELLLNAYTLSGEDVKEAATLLEAHQIPIDAVCLQDELYREVEHCFPGIQKVYSYNNGLRTIRDFEEIAAKHSYDYYVVGSAGIRNNELFQHIKQSGKKVILLINNGCSFNCGWCRTQGSCQKTFCQNRKSHSVEYLYALQSVLPNELYDGTIDLSAIDLLKFSNRTSNLRYTQRGLDSYLSGAMVKYIRRNRMNYSLYARMQGFWRCFPFLRLRKIKKYKEEILGHPVVFK